MPTGWEQDVAEVYVNYRQLLRPKTDIRTAFISVFLFLLVSGIFSCLIHYIFITVGVFAYFPLYMQDFYSKRPLLSLIILCVFVILVELLFCFKYAVIGMIKLYQHYAPDEIRRRCIFMPTCSEYTIMAVQKYGSFIGLCKSLYRLVYRCRGNIYMIDYPWEKARVL